MSAKWICCHCTLLNAARRRRCQVCESRRPSADCQSSFSLAASKSSSSPPPENHGSTEDSSRGANLKPAPRKHKRTEVLAKSTIQFSGQQERKRSRKTEQGIVTVKRAQLFGATLGHEIFKKRSHGLLPPLSRTVHSQSLDHDEDSTKHFQTNVIPQVEDDREQKEEMKLPSERTREMMPELVLGEASSLDKRGNDSHPQPRDRIFPPPMSLSMTHTASQTATEPYSTNGEQQGLERDAKPLDASVATNVDIASISEQNLVAKTALTSAQQFCLLSERPAYALSIHCQEKAPLPTAPFKPAERGSETEQGTRRQVLYQSAVPVSEDSSTSSPSKEKPDRLSPNTRPASVNTVDSSCLQYEGSTPSEATPKTFCQSRAEESSNNYELSESTTKPILGGSKPINSVIAIANTQVTRPTLERYDDARNFICHVDPSDRKTTMLAPLLGQLLQAPTNNSPRPNEAELRSAKSQEGSDEKDKSKVSLTHTSQIDYSLDLEGDSPGPGSCLVGDYSITLNSSENHGIMRSGYDTTLEFHECLATISDARVDDALGGHHKIFPERSIIPANEECINAIVEFDEIQSILESLGQLVTTPKQKQKTSPALATEQRLLQSDKHAGLLNAQPEPEESATQLIIDDPPSSGEEQERESTELPFAGRNGTKTGGLWSALQHDNTEHKPNAFMCTPPASQTSQGDNSIPGKLHRASLDRPALSASDEQLSHAKNDGINTRHDVKVEEDRSTNPGSGKQPCCAKKHETNTRHVTKAEALPAAPSRIQSATCLPHSLPELARPRLAFELTLRDVECEPILGDGDESSKETEPSIPFEETVTGDSSPRTSVANLSSRTPTTSDMPCNRSCLRDRAESTYCLSLETAEMGVSIEVSKAELRCAETLLSDSHTIAMETMADTTDLPSAGRGADVLVSRTSLNKANHFLEGTALIREILREASPEAVVGEKRTCSHMCVPEERLRRMVTLQTAEKSETTLPAWGIESSNTSSRMSDHKPCNAFQNNTGHSKTGGSDSSSQNKTPWAEVQRHGSIRPPQAMKITFTGPGDGEPRTLRGLQTARKSTSTAVSENTLQGAGHVFQELFKEHSDTGFTHLRKGQASNSILHSVGSSCQSNGACEISWQASHNNEGLKPVGGFRTAGKASSIAVSENALKRAGRLFRGMCWGHQSPSTSFSYSREHQACSLILHPAGSSYQRKEGCDKSFQSSQNNEALKSLGGFSTAGKSKSIAVSEDALQRAGQLFQRTSKEHHRQNTVCSHSREGQADPNLSANQSIGTSDRSWHFPHNKRLKLFGGFHTAGKSTSILVSEGALKRAGQLFRRISKGHQGQDTVCSHQWKGQANVNWAVHEANSCYQSVRGGDESWPPSHNKEGLESFGGIRPAGRSKSISVPEDTLQRAGQFFQRGCKEHQNLDTGFFHSWQGQATTNSSIHSAGSSCQGSRGCRRAWHSYPKNEDRLEAEENNEVVVLHTKPPDSQVRNTASASDVSCHHPSSILLDPPKWHCLDDISDFRPNPFGVIEGPGNPSNLCSAEADLDVSLMCKRTILGHNKEGRQHYHQGWANGGHCLDVSPSFASEKLAALTTPAGFRNQLSCSLLEQSPGSEYTECFSSDGFQYQTTTRVALTDRLTLFVNSAAQVNPCRDPLESLNAVLKTTKMAKDLNQCRHNNVLGITLRVNNVNASNLLFRVGYNSSSPHSFGQEQRKQKQDQGIAGHSNDLVHALIAVGCRKDYINEKWLRNHKRWIVWKLAAMERRFSLLFGGVLLKYDVLVEQLHSRYCKEYQEGQRSALRKILNKDISPARMMILCVCQTFAQPIETKNVGSGQGPDKSIELKAAYINYTLEVTDGWYSVLAVPDQKICEFIDKGRIVAGTKLLVSGAFLVGGEEGLDPLDVLTEPLKQKQCQVFLKISANSTRIAKWDARLGFVPLSRQLQTDNGLLRVKRIADVIPGGGSLQLINLLVCRKYPLMFLHRRGGGQENEFLTEAEEHMQRAAFELRKQKMIERFTEEVEQECTVDVDQMAPPVWQRMVASLLPEDFYSGLDNEDKKTVERWRSKRGALLQTRIEQEVQAKIDDELSLVRDSNPVLRMLVKSYDGSLLHDPPTQNEKAILTIWSPSEEQFGLLQEGAALRFENLSARQKYEGRMQLSANGRTRIGPCCHPPLPREAIASLYSTHRTFSSIYHIHVVSRRLLELKDERSLVSADFDFVGVVLKVVTNKSDRGLSVYLSDKTKLVVRVHSSNPTVLGEVIGVRSSISEQDLELPQVVAFRDLLVRPFDQVENVAVLEFKGVTSLRLQNADPMIKKLSQWAESTIGRACLRRLASTLDAGLLALQRPLATFVPILGYIAGFTTQQPKELRVLVDSGTRNLHEFGFPLRLLPGLELPSSFDKVHSLNPQKGFLYNDQMLPESFYQAGCGVLYRFLLKRTRKSTTSFRPCEFEVCQIMPADMEAVCSVY